ncbi:MFS transporter [Aestuariimicrobium ganziense]|uniref:MFS transporter n=1 Tax=Aestuariimicrobium ganziense TaxID=2773677 RepID=UPI002E2B57DA|nr:MFS transporter [Aestuariimicrobium ganziense]
MPLPSSLRQHLIDTRPLANDHFRRLWIAGIATMIGAQLTVVSVPAQIWTLTQDSGFVGLTGLFGLVPLLVFGLWGGAIADAFDRRRVLMVTTTGLIVTSFLFFVQSWLDIGNVWVILTIFSLQQAFFAVNSPARTAITPQLVPAGQLPAANILSTTVFLLGGVAGPMVGGTLIPVLGFTWLYFADSILLFATLYAVVKLPAMVPEGSSGRKAGLASIVDGLRYLRWHHVLLFSFVVDIIAMVFGMPRILFPQAANLDFGGPVEGGLALALLFAAIPLGGVLGGLVSGWVSRVERQGRAVVLCVLVWGVGVVVFGAAVWVAGGTMWPWLGVGLVALAIGGAADTASSAFRGTMLLEAAGDDVRGRLQGVFFIVVVGGPRIADVLHGAVAAKLDAGPTTLWGGVLVVLGMLVMPWVAPALWRYRVKR